MDINEHGFYPQTSGIRSRCSLHPVLRDAEKWNPIPSYWYRASKAIVNHPPMAGMNHQDMGVFFFKTLRVLVIFSASFCGLLYGFCLICFWGKTHKKSWPMWFNWGTPQKGCPARHPWTIDQHCHWSNQSWPQIIDSDGFIIPHSFLWLLVNKPLYYNIKFANLFCSFLGGSSFRVLGARRHVVGENTKITLRKRQDLKGETMELSSPCLDSKIFQIRRDFCLVRSSFFRWISWKSIENIILDDFSPSMTWVFLGQDSEKWSLSDVRPLETIGEIKCSAATKINENPMKLSLCDCFMESFQQNEATNQLLAENLIWKWNTYYPLTSTQRCFPHETCLIRTECSTHHSFA